MRIGNVAHPTVQMPKQFQDTSKFIISREVKASILTDKANFSSLIVSIFFIIGQATLIGLYFKNLPPEIPLFYSMPWGESILGKNVFLWILPAVSMSFILLNFLVYFIFLRGNKFLARILFISCMVISFGTFWSSLKIVTLLS